VNSTLIMPAGDREIFLASLLRRLGALPERKWSITIEPYVKRRSTDQNSLLWKLYTDVLKQGGEALRGWTVEEIHEYMLGEYHGWEEVTGFGRRKLRPKKRSSRLTTSEFSDYVEFVVMRSAEHGIVLQMPGEIQG
jgi:hypothetical protein